MLPLDGKKKKGRKRGGGGGCGDDEQSDMPRGIAIKSLIGALSPPLSGGKKKTPSSGAEPQGALGETHLSRQCVSEEKKKKEGQSSLERKKKKMPGEEKKGKGKSWRGGGRKKGEIRSL